MYTHIRETGVVHRESRHVAKDEASEVSTGLVSGLVLICPLEAELYAVTL